MQQKCLGVEKITKIILLLMKIVEEMHKKNKTLKQHDDRSAVEIHLKNLFYTNIERFTKMNVQFQLLVEHYITPSVSTFLLSYL